MKGTGDTTGYTIDVGKRRLAGDGRALWLILRLDFGVDYKRTFDLSRNNANNV